MSDLAEAIDYQIFVDIALPIEERRHQAKMVSALKGAARRVLEGEQVQWCEVHKAQIRLPSAERLCIAGWLLKRADETPACSIVPKLLVAAMREGVGDE